MQIKGFFASSRAYLLLLLFLIAAENIPAVQIKLSNGTVFTGDIISQNENFIQLQVGQSKISIAKSMVTDVTGLPAGTAIPGIGSAAAQPAQSQQAEVTRQAEATPASAGGQQAIAPGCKVELTLTTGAKYKGKVVASDERIVTLEGETGSRITIYRHMITNIDNLSPPVSTSAHKSESVKQSEATRAPASQEQKITQEPADARSTMPGSKVELTLTTGAKYKGNVVASDERTVTLEGETGSRITIYRHLIATVDNLSSPVSTSPAVPAKPEAVPEVKIQPPAPKPVPQPQPLLAQSVADSHMSMPPKSVPMNEVKDHMVQKPDSAATHNPEPAKQPEAARAPAALELKKTQEPVEPRSVVPAQSQVQPVVQTPTSVSAPSTSAASPQPSGGKNSLVLKTGMVFTGTIVSENDRFLTFSTAEGTSINILRRLIRTIDGVPYVMKPGSAATPADTSSQLQRIALGAPGAPVAVNAAAKGAGAVPQQQTMAFSRRMMPKVVMRPGVSMAEVIDSLKSISWEQRSMVSRELGVMGQWATNAIPALSVLMGDTAGGAAGAGMPPLGTDSASIQKLLSPGLEAARALSRMGARGIDELAARARNANPIVRQQAIFGLGEAQNAQEQPLLREAIKDADGRVRAMAAHALRFPEAAPLLIAALDDRDGEVRTYAAASLGETQSLQAVKPLVTMLKDVRPSVRAQAAAALGKLRAHEAVAAIVDLVNDVSGEVREKAVIALGAMIDSAAVPALLTALKDNEPAVRKAAAEALGDIRDPRAIPSLYSAMQETVDSVRGAVGFALKMHTEIPLLIAALDNPNDLVRDNAAYILWLMSGKNIGHDKQAWIDWYSNQGRDESTAKRPKDTIKK